MARTPLTLLWALLVAACGAPQRADGALVPDAPPANSADVGVKPDVPVAPAPDAAAAPDAASERADAASAGPEVTEPPEDASGPGPGRCVQAVDSGWHGIPEASGAVRFPDGRLLVVADSGHHGRALWTGPDGVETAVTLPLDGPRDAEGRPSDDDLEGLSLGPDGDLFGITSAGWLRRWRRDGEAFVQLGASAPIAVDERLACASRGVNCGPNYEGLCLRPASPAATASGLAACAGFAASKARGELVCLAFAAPRDGEAPRLVATGLVVPTGIPADQLADCAFPPAEAGVDGVLLAGNLYAGSELWWFDLASQTLGPAGASGPPNQEAVAFLEGGRWRAWGDLQSLAPNSPWQDLTCDAP